MDENTQKKEHRNTLGNYIEQGIEIKARFQKTRDIYEDRIRKGKDIPEPPHAYITDVGSSMVTFLPGEDPIMSPMIEINKDGYVFTDVQGVGKFSDIQEDHIHLFSVEDNFLPEGIEYGDEVIITGTVSTYYQKHKVGGYDYRIIPTNIRKA